MPMQTNDQTSPADESGTSKAADKAAETDSKPNGLVKSLLGAVLEGKDAVVVKADSSAKDQEEKVGEQAGEQVGEQTSEAASDNPDK